MGRRPSEDAARGWRLFDVGALLTIVLVAFAEQASRFRAGEYIDLGPGGDWIAHAYRAQVAATSQLTSWDPAWDRGYPPLDGWQAAPDLLTGLASRLLHTSLPRTMLLMTMLCLVSYPVAGYVALRLLRCGPLAGLLGAALLLDSPALFTVVQDYSGLFGLAALPLAVWVIIAHFGGRGGWAGAVLVGLLVELHPFAAVAGVTVLVARLVVDRGRHTRRVFAQCLVAFTIGAPYWLTFLTFARPRAADTGTEASIAFARAHFIFHVGVAELPLAMLPLLAATLLILVARRLPHARLTLCCLGGAAIMSTLLFLSYLGWMPKAVMEAQLTRSMPYALVLLAMGAAPIADLFPAVVARLVRSRRTASAGAAVVVALVGLVLAADGERAATRYSDPVTAAAYPAGGDIAAWLGRHPDAPRPAVFWADPDVAAAGSYFAFGQVEFTSDYTARGWSVANSAINRLLTERASYATVEPYLRAEGVAYLYVADRRAEAATADDWLSAGSVKLLSRGVAGRIIGVRSPSPAAFAAPATVVRAAHVPDLSYYTDPGASAQLGRYMERWANVTAPATVRPAATVVESPSVRRLSVDGQRGDILVVGQRWDAAWTAAVGGRAVSTERVGPDLLGVELNAAGPQTVVLQHHPSLGEESSIALALAAIIVAAVATVFDGYPGNPRRPRRRPGPAGPVARRPSVIA